MLVELKFFQDMIISEFLIFLYGSEHVGLIMICVILEYSFKLIVSIQINNGMDTNILHTIFKWSHINLMVYIKILSMASRNRFAYFFSSTDDIPSLSLQRSFVLVKFSSFLFKLYCCSISTIPKK